MNADLQLAFVALGEQVAQRDLDTSVKIEQDGDYIRVALTLENRDVWVGHSPGNGFFLVASPDDEPHAFFALNAEAVSNFLPVCVSDPVTLDEQQSRDWATLLNSISNGSPDVKSIEEILDRASPTNEGLDVLSTVAAIRARRNAISKLSAMMKNESTTECAFQELFAAEPWMLGAQYHEVVGKERIVWFGARVDLLLASVLGYVDVVELKRPDTSILTASARTWRKTKELSATYAQAYEYLRLLDENRTSIEKELGLSEATVSRMYRSSVIIVAGRQPEEKRAKDVIRELNAAHSRIILMTYDEVHSIAEATVALFERRLVRHDVLLGC
jgi:Domain of unknown function (DUF4263)